MKLIIGLGNPDKKYELTRHNTGFRAVDVLVGKNNWKMDDKFDAIIAETKIGKFKTILAKPQNYMNNSGEAVGKIARYYKIKKQDILIIFDDIDLLVGTLRLRPNGSSGGHNGMQSVIASMKTDEIARLKIGVAEKKAGKQRTSSENYILKPASKDVETILKKSLSLVPEIIDEWLAGANTTTTTI